MSDEVDFCSYMPTAVAEAAGRAFAIMRAAEIVSEGATVDTVIAVAEAIFKYIMPENWDKDKDKAKVRNRISIVKSEG